MSIEFSDRELDVMKILWNKGSCTVREARQEIDEELAYTTVLSVFQTLENKGHVGHEEEGKAYRYYPQVSREEAQKNAIGRVVERLFSGSPKAALTTLIGDDSVSQETLKRARRELEDDS